MRIPFVLAAITIALVTLDCGSVSPTTSPSSVATGSAPSRSNNPATSSPSPSPSPAPGPSPSLPPPIAPGAGSGAVQITVTPNPVPFSGQPITDIASCATRPNTWFYDQVLKETGGVPVTITRRVDTFDGAAGSATNPNVKIAANGSTTIHTRWCSVASTAHTAQSAFSGTDANGKAWSATGPLVHLSAK